jgi:nucleoside-diphosphate-sugar epimerase
MTKVLVTGGTGFVGANLVRKLLQDDYEVHCLVRSSEIAWRLTDVADTIQFHVGDLQHVENIKQILQIVKPAHIFHLATAGVYGGVSSTDIAVMQTNILGFINLVEAANIVGYDSFINTGSSSEYGIKNVPMHENMKCEPALVYGISKLSASYYALLIARTHNKPITTLRLFSPYGPFDNSNRFITQAIVWSLMNKELRFGNPHSVRDFIFIDDVISAYMSAMSNISVTKGQIINIGSGQEVTMEATARRIQHICDSVRPIRWGSASALRPGESQKWQADITKAKQYMGWEPVFSLAEGLEKTVQWFRMNLPYYG